MIVAFRTSNGSYVSAENGGGGRLVSRQTAIGDAEKFVFMMYRDNKDGNKLKARIRAHNGSYLCAEDGGGGTVNANRSTAAQWETFELVEAGANRYAIKTFNGTNYFCAEQGGGAEITANRTAVGAWEVFEVVPQPYVWGDLEIGFTTKFERIWSDHGSGADQDGAFWRPIPPSGFRALGDICRVNYSDPNSDDTVALVVKDLSGNALRLPERFERIWSDHGSGADEDVSVWEPVPPPGYIALGVVTNRAYAEPSKEVVVCVREELTARGAPYAPLYSDRGSGADEDFSAWTVRPTNVNDGEIQLSPGTFVAVRSHDKPSNHRCANVLRLQINEILPNTIPGRPQVPNLQPGQIPPKFANNTVHYTIYLPWYAVEDRGYSDPQKLLRSPIYRLDREDQYEMVKYLDNRGKSVPQTTSVAYMAGFAKAESHSFSETTTIKIGWKWGGSVGLDANKTSVEKSIEISQSFTYGYNRTETETEQTTHTYNLTVPPGKLGAVYVIRFIPSGRNSSRSVCAGFCPRIGTLY
jgi:hypothetical protein